MFVSIEGSCWGRCKKNTKVSFIFARPISSFLRKKNLTRANPPTFTKNNYYHTLVGGQMETGLSGLDILLCHCRHYIWSHIQFLPWHEYSLLLSSDRDQVKSLSLKGKQLGKKGLNMHHAGIAGMEDRWASGVDRLPRLGLSVLLMQYFISHIWPLTYYVCCIYMYSIYYFANGILHLSPLAYYIYGRWHVYDIQC